MSNATCPHCHGTGEIKDRSEEGRNRPCGYCDADEIRSRGTRAIPCPTVPVVIELQTQLVERIGQEVLKRNAPSFNQMLRQILDWFFEHQDAPGEDAGANGARWRDGH